MTTSLRDLIQFILLTIISLLVIFYNYIEWKHLGFPDGHLTELDRAYNVLLPVFSVLYFILLLTATYQLPKKRINLKRFRSWLFILLGLQFVLSYVLTQVLEHGAGG